MSAEIRENIRFGTHKDLIEKVLDELLLEGSGSQEAVEISPQKLGDKVTMFISRAIS